MLTLHAPRRRVGSAALLLVAALAGTTATAQAGGAAAFRAAFSNPPRGQTAWHAGSAITLAWSEAEPGSVTARSLLEQRARPDLDGGCTAVEWLDVGTVAPEADTYRATPLVAGSCYRWTITLVEGAASESATSGSLRTYAAWTGRYDIYRSEAFSTQQTFTWCTAASTQMMLNLVLGQHDHSRAGQQRIISYEKRHDRYPDGVAHGSDPQGWAAALNHFGAGSYSWVKSSTRAGALKKAAQQMRLTHKPVGLLVEAGNHAWVMVGFTATADPAFTDAFRVTGVYIMGPLYPIQVNAKGYFDPRPNHYYATTKLAPAFTRYRDNLGPKWSIWEGSWVTINP